jgi:uroporphyrinogen decarboxylase
MARFGVEVIGVDYRVGLTEARRLAGDGVALQGNLDPAILLGPRDLVVARTQAMLAANGGRPGYIANLGHGITQETAIENVEAFVKTVQESGAFAPAPGSGR